MGRVGRSGVVGWYGGKRTGRRNPGTKAEYRLVYMTPSLKQIVFYLNYDDNKVNVNKAFILNFGYGDLKKDDPIYLSAV